MIKIKSGSKETICALYHHMLKRYDNMFNICLNKKIKSRIKKMDNKFLFKDLIPFIIKISETGYYKEILYNSKHIKKFIRESKTRFSFILLGLVGIETENEVSRKWSHMNLLIYDKILNVIYRFDPQGEACIYNEESVNNELLKIFKKYKIKYISLDKYLPILKNFIKDNKDYYRSAYGNFENITNYNCGPQTIEGLNKKDKNIDPPGYCTYWCFSFINFILKNYRKYRNVNIVVCLNDMIYEIDNKNVSFLEYIRFFGYLITTLY